MAVSTGVSGNLCTLTIEGAAVAESRTFTLTQNQAVIDLTNRDSAWWAQFIAGIRDWEISGDGLYIYNDLARRRLQWHYSARNPVVLDVILTLSWHEAVIGPHAPVAAEYGKVVFTAKCILTNLTYPAPHDDAATISFTLKGTEALTPEPS